MILLQLRTSPLRTAKLFNLGPYVSQIANITGRGSRGAPLTLMKPFPYEDKPFKLYHRFYDNTMVRVSQENAKIIVVEGPIGAGKTAFATALAEQLDMHYMPQVTMDLLYVLPSGLDLRQFDHELPKIIQTYDHKNFCVNPTDTRAARFQYQMLYLKFFQFFDALAHLLNTGQGVILERSYFSDFVFLEAMYEQKYISAGVRNMYYYIFKNTCTFLLPPHLVIYLDVPVATVQERIRTRKFSYEQNSPALTKEYLQSLEKCWKQKYLKQASKNSEVLVYNWSDGGDVEIVVEDIEKIDFDVLRRDKRFQKWALSRGQLAMFRERFTNDKQDHAIYFRHPTWQVPELDVSNRIMLKQDAIFRKIPECRYAPGYNYNVGGSILNILFKTGRPKHREIYHFLNFFVEDDGM